MSAQKKPSPQPFSATHNEAANDSLFAIPQESDDDRPAKGNLTMLAAGIGGVAALVAVLAVAGYLLGNLLSTLGAL